MPVSKSLKFRHKPAEWRVPACLNSLAVVVLQKVLARTGIAPVAPPWIIDRDPANPTPRGTAYLSTWRRTVERPAVL